MSNLSELPPVSSAIPAKPRRSKWKLFGKICLYVLGFFILLIVALNIPWDIKAPPTPDLDFPDQKLAPAENAFTWFEKAGLALVTEFSKDAAGTKRGWGELIGKIGDEKEKWDPVFAAEVLTANVAVLADLETGLACQQYLPPPNQSPMDEGCSLYPRLQKHKALVQLLCLKSKQAQLSGDPAAAVKPAMQGFRFGQKVANNSRSLIEWLVGIACENIALERLEELAADAKTPVPVLAEIQAGLAEWKTEAFNQGYKNAMRGEFELAMLAAQTIHETGMRGNNPQDKPMKMRNFYFFKPNMMRRDFAAFFRHQIQMADLPRIKVTVDYPGKPADSTSRLGQLRLLFRPNAIGIILLQMEIPAIEKSMLNKFRLQVNVEALRLQIALRLYEQKHGQLPDQLTALVPEFLLAVPNDPMDDRPFRYAKAKEQIWSVGDDGIDNGGKIDGKNLSRPRKGYDQVMPSRPGELRPDQLPPPEPSSDESPF
jgi:hypothetical protein